MAGGWGSTGLWVEAASWCEIAGLWSMGLACLKGMAQQSRDRAGLCKPWGHGLAEQRSCVCVSQAWQAWGSWPSEMEIVQAWVRGLVEITNVCGALAWQALRARLEEIMRVWGVGVWGSTVLLGQRSRAGGSEIPQCVEQWLLGPMGWGLACSAGYSLLGPRGWEGQIGAK
jgi:hypothetical protein